MMSEITKHIDVVQIHCLRPELGLCLYQQSNKYPSQTKQKEQESGSLDHFPPKLLSKNVLSPVRGIRRLKIKHLR